MNARGPTDDQPTVTVEQVLEFAPVRAATAEKIAAYTTLRARGVLPVDASREVGVSWPQTGLKYEHWALALQERLGLPEFVRAPGFRSLSSGRAQAAGRRGGLAKGHAGHVQVVPGCPRCSSGTQPVGGGA